MTISVMDKTRARLTQTPEGSALLELIDQYKTPALLASALGFNQQSVRQWILRGRISKRGALRVSDSLGYSKEALRPDLQSDEWDRKPVGAEYGRKPVARTGDAKLLVDLAEQFGTVKSLCDAAYCSVADYHTWKSRGKIPAIKLPTLLALQQ